MAALLQKAIGDQLTCVFVDNGLLRLNEGDQVMKTFAENMGVKVIRSNAQQQFYKALSNENDPEMKRKIIGNAFIEVFNHEAQKLKDIKFLAQGTIYPDVIESAGASSGKAKVIKSHHNVGGLPENMQFELVEPLKELFKDEVRTIGVKLGITRKHAISSSVSWTWFRVFVFLGKLRKNTPIFLDLQTISIWRNSKNTIYITRLIKRLLFFCLLNQSVLLVMSADMTMLLPFEQLRLLIL